MAATKTKKPKKAAGPVLKLPPIKLVELPAGRQEVVPLQKLWFDGKADRDGALADRDLRPLAESLASRGQLQPIVVTEFGAPAGKLRVVAGHRRVRAMRDVLHLDDCDAVIINFESEADVLAARETENLQRQDLNPIEEATAVANLLEAVAFEAAIAAGASIGTKPFTRELADELLSKGGVAVDANRHDLVLQPRVREKAIELVAARLAKSETWVRDRAFLGRLEGKARELVLSGRLSLGAARIIVQVPDAKVRDELAKRAAENPRDPYGRPMALEQVRAEVAEYLYTLAGVPWQLNVPFAGKPACDTCQFNSANDPGLFEHGVSARTSVRHGGTTRSEQAGVCTNHACWREKNSVANAAVLKAAKKAEATIITVKGKPTDASVKAAASQAAPAFVRVAAVAERAQARVEAGRTKKHQAARQAPAPNQTEAVIRREAQYKWGAAMREWVEKHVNPALHRWLAARPGSWPLFVLLREHELWHKVPGQHGAKVLQTPAWRALVSLLKDPSWQAVLELEKGGKRMYGLLDAHDTGTSGIAASLVEILGIEVGSKPPTLDKFLPDALKPAPAKPAAAPKRRKAAAHSPDDSDPGQLGGGDVGGDDDEEGA